MFYKVQVQKLTCLVKQGHKIVLEPILYQPKSMLWIIILGKCPSEWHNFLIMDILQNILEVKSDVSVGNSMYWTDNIPQETTSDYNIAGPVLNSHFCEENAELFTIRASNILSGVVSKQFIFVLKLNIIFDHFCSPSAPDQL